MLPTRRSRTVRERSTQSLDSRTDIGKKSAVMVIRFLSNYRMIPLIPFVSEIKVTRDTGVYGSGRYEYA